MVNEARGRRWHCGEEEGMMQVRMMGGAGDS